MMSFFRSMFSGPEGEISMKRFTAVALIIAGIVKAFLSDDVAMMAGLIGAGSAILGVAAITKS
jgi:hypothetical protein